jgi:cyanophycinase-like exopeptidase
MKPFFLLLLSFFISCTLHAQAYVSYFTGNTGDLITSPKGGICLMGGATEDDNAMRWFLQQANGGDILVLRTTGSNGYNNYLYSDLGIDVHSVETIVCTSPAAAYHPYVLQRIAQAEAIWFAGGNQWSYISTWLNTPADSIINTMIAQRHITIGGTSAGMAIQGGFYFSAQNGTVTSSTALANPYHSLVTIDSSHFIAQDVLREVITDTHFDNPDRKGRLMTFLAKIYEDYGVFAKAIACEEYTAVCIDSSGTGRVFGGWPATDDNAYFVSSNCELSQPAPENCTPGQALTWSRGGMAVKACRIRGTANGANTFSIPNWQGTGNLSWFHWSANNGVFIEQAGTAPQCIPTAEQFPSAKSPVHVYPNPFDKQVFVYTDKMDASTVSIRVVSLQGQIIPIPAVDVFENGWMLNTQSLAPGIYFLSLFTNGKMYTNQILQKVSE